jgi:hypothetical protein
MAAVGWLDAHPRGTGELAQLLLFPTTQAHAGTAREIEALANRWYLAADPTAATAANTRAALVLDLRSFVLVHAGAPAFAVPQQSVLWAEAARSNGHVVVYLATLPPPPSRTTGIRQHLAEAAAGTLWAGRVRTTGGPKL